MKKIYTLHLLFYSSLTIINKTKKASCPKYAARTTVFLKHSVVVAKLVLTQWSQSVLSNPQKYQCDSMGLQEVFHHSAIVLCITFHVWKSIDCYFSNKVYRDNLRFLLVHRNSLKCLCTLYLKNSNLQIFIHEKLCIKL